RIDVEARYAVLDDLQRAAVTGGEGGQARHHRLDDGQAERFEQGRLHEHAAPFGDVAVQFSCDVLVQAQSEPARLAVQGVAVHQFVHAGDLFLFLVIARLRLVHVPGDHQQVRLPTQPRAASVPLHQAGDVLDAVEPRHGEDQRL